MVATASGFVQVGAVSFGGTDVGPVCGEAGAPGVYTNLAVLADFIGSHATQASFVSLDPATPAAPAAPVIAASVEGTSVGIEWTAYEGATGYTLYYAPFPEQSPISNLDMGSALSVSGELPVGSAFYIAVQPYNASGAIDILSNVATFTVTGDGS